MQRVPIIQGRALLIPSPLIREQFKRTQWDHSLRSDDDFSCHATRYPEAIPLNNISAVKSGIV